MYFVTSLYKLWFSRQYIFRTLAIKYCWTITSYNIVFFFFFFYILLLFHSSKGSWNTSDQQNMRNSKNIGHVVLRTREYLIYTKSYIQKLQIAWGVYDRNIGLKTINKSIWHILVESFRTLENKFKIFKDIYHSLGSGILFWTIYS